MGIWVGLVVLVVVVLVAALVVRGGKEGRALRGELRRLRAAENRGPDTHTPAERRRDMLINPMPGKGTTPHGP
jgi:hypothetical protein